MEGIFYPPFFVFCFNILSCMPLTDDYSTIAFSGTKGATNNTTGVTVVADPGTGANPYVVDKEDLGILNEDTVSQTFILRLTGGTSRILERVTLNVGDKWTNPNRIIVNPGETVTIELTGSVTTNQLPWSVAYFQVIN